MKRERTFRITPTISSPAGSKTKPIKVLYLDGLLFLGAELFCAILCHMSQERLLGEYELPLRLVSAIGAAAILGITRQRFTQLLAVGSERIPEPIGYLNDLPNKPVWLRSQFE